MLKHPQRGVAHRDCADCLARLKLYEALVGVVSKVEVNIIWIVNVTSEFFFSPQKTRLLCGLRSQRR